MLLLSWICVQCCFNDGAVKWSSLTWESQTEDAVRPAHCSTDKLNGYLQKWKKQQQTSKQWKCRFQLWCRFMMNTEHDSLWLGRFDFSQRIALQVSTKKDKLSYYSLSNCCTNLCYLLNNFSSLLLNIWVVHISLNLQILKPLSQYCWNDSCEKPQTHAFYENDKW